MVSPAQHACPAPAPSPATVSLYITCNHIYWAATDAASTARCCSNRLPHAAIMHSQLFQDLIGAYGNSASPAGDAQSPVGTPLQCGSPLAARVCCNHAPESPQSDSSGASCDTPMCPANAAFSAERGVAGAPAGPSAAITVRLAVPADSFAQWLDFVTAAPAAGPPAACSGTDVPMRKAGAPSVATLHAALHVADVVIDMHTISTAARMLGAALFLAPLPPPASAIEVRKPHCLILPASLLRTLQAMLARWLGLPTVPHAWPSGRAVWPHDAPPNRLPLQEFTRLPADVAMAALRTSGAPFEELCLRLPPPLHPLALHASFPTITACGGLDLSHTAPLATALSPCTLPTLAHITFLALVNHTDLRAGGAQRAYALHSLTHALPLLRHLSSLDISQNSLGDADMAQISHSLQHLSGTLETLQLASNLIESPIAAGLGTVLASARHLEVLDMHSNLIDCSGFQELSPYIIALRSVKSLNLSCNKLASFGATALGALVATWGCVEDLDVSGNGIAAAGVATLLEGLARKSLATVQALDLSFNDFRKRDWSDVGVAVALSRFRNLQVLDVGFNEVHTAGCAALSATLRRLPMLRQLGLYRAGIGESAARLLVSGVSRLSWLEALDLRHNRVRHAGAALVAALPAPARLQRLRLCGNRLGDDAAAQLLEALPQRAIGLEMLGLSRNRMGSRASAALAAALPALPRMHEVRLDDNALTRGDMERLKEFACVVLPGGSGLGAVGAAADMAAAAAGECAVLGGWGRVHANELWDNAVMDDLQTFSSGESRSMRAAMAQ